MFEKSSSENEQEIEIPEKYLIPIDKFSLNPHQANDYMKLIRQFLKIGGEKNIKQLKKERRIVDARKKIEIIRKIDAMLKDFDRQNKFVADIFQKKGQENISPYKRDGKFFRHKIVNGIVIQVSLPRYDDRYELYLPENDIEEQIVVISELPQEANIAFNIARDLAKQGSDGKTIFKFIRDVSFDQKKEIKDFLKDGHYHRLEIINGVTLKIYWWKDDTHVMAFAKDGITKKVILSEDILEAHRVFEDVRMALQKPDNNGVIDINILAKSTARIYSRFGVR